MAVPKTLEDRVRERRVIPFVGAGVSMAVLDKKGSRIFPNWRELLDRAAVRLDLEQRPEPAEVVRALLKLKDKTSRLYEAAEAAQQGLDGKWHSFLKEQFTVSRKNVMDGSLGLARRVWRLGSRLVITTNYDRVLYWACPFDWREDLQQWSLNNTIEHGHLLRHGVQEPTLWHLHGKIDNVGEVVLTPDGYQKLYPEAGAAPVYETAYRTLHTLLATHTFLFIGSSMQDPLFSEQLRAVARLFSGGTGDHYVVAPEADGEADTIRDLHLPLEVLPYEKHGPPLLDLLDEIAALGMGGAYPRPYRRPVPMRRGAPPPPVEPGLRNYLLVTAREFLGELPPGFETLTLRDLIGKDGVYIEWPWSLESGAPGPQELIEFMLDHLPGRMLVLGEPGHGKTLVMKKLFLALAWRFARGESEWIPLYIPLRDFSYDGPGLDGTLGWLWRYLHERGLPLQEQEFDTLVSSGRIILLFDGLDEVRGDVRQDVVNGVVTWPVFEENAVVSCRRNFYELYLAASTLQQKYPVKIRLQPLIPEDESFSTFVVAFCALKAGRSGQKDVGAQILRRIQRSPELLELARTPLLLVMILDLFSDHPERLKAEWSLSRLYADYTLKWLQTQAAKLGSRLSWDRKALLMAQVAWESYQSGAPAAYAYQVYQSASFSRDELKSILAKGPATSWSDVPLDQVVDDVCGYTLLDTRSDGRYHFRHKSFQEYFVARYIFDRIRGIGEDLSPVLSDLIPVEVAGFLRGLLGSSMQHAERKVAADNLMGAYVRNAGTEPRVVSLRDHAAYYLAHLGTPHAVGFLLNALEEEPDKCVQRSIIVGLALSGAPGVPESLMTDYVASLDHDRETASINRGYHLVYYGDQPLEEGFFDCRGLRVEGSVRNILRHLRSEHYRKWWILDLATLRSLVETRGRERIVEALRPADLVFLREQLEPSRREESELMANEKRRLARLLALEAA